MNSLSKEIVQESVSPQDGVQEFNFAGTARMPERFALLSRLVMRDLNSRDNAPTFYKYSRDNIQTYLANPYSNQKALRDAVIYIYNASSHFRRIIQYFEGLSDLAYVVSPYKLDMENSKKSMEKSVDTVKKNYHKTLNILSSMDIQNQFRRILRICLREDTAFCTLLVTKDDIYVQVLPSDYCNISTIEGGVFNVTFDFSYFAQRSEQLAYYPPEFQQKYELYKQNTSAYRYQELDSPTSFAIKCNTDTPSYSVPPLAGILREVYDIEDYKSLKLTRAELENYAMLVMGLDTKDDGTWKYPLETAKEFYHNLDSVLPSAVGSVLSPMKIEKISFDRSGGVSDTDYVSQAENQLYNSSGVSSLLFNNSKAAASALKLSIQVDQSVTFGIVKSIEKAINRYIQSQTCGKNFRVTFLDCSPFNRKELGDGYLKACQYGIPMVEYYCASQGLMQAEMEGMNLLENDILHIHDKFKPLRSSATQSSKAGDGEAGAPTKDDDELTESGEKSRDEDPSK